MEKVVIPVVVPNIYHFLWPKLLLIRDLSLHIVSLINNFCHVLRHISKLPSYTLPASLYLMHDKLFLPTIYFVPPRTPPSIRYLVAAGSH